MPQILAPRSFHGPGLSICRPLRAVRQPHLTELVSATPFDHDRESSAVRSVLDAARNGASSERELLARVLAALKALTG